MKFNYCPKCGEELVKNSNFCHSCGRELEVEASESEDNKSEENDTEIDSQREEELGEAAQKLKNLLSESPGIYDSLSPLEQRVIDELDLTPDSAQED